MSIEAGFSNIDLFFTRIIVSEPVVSFCVE